MRAGERLAGRYRIDERLGRGGMGEVWRGFDLALDRPVAVKLLLDGMTEEQLVARFRREATIGARLQHPGITVVHDIGRHTDLLFIVMELLEGSDMTTLLARSPGGLPIADAVRIAHQIAEALAAAHAQKVVHRDLKPANLFLLPDGRLKVCDFGIARVADASTSLTGTGWMIGTPPYMAPEQWRGDQVDARCDLYALGCVIHELVAGSSPFAADPHPMAVMRRHLEDSPRALRDIRSDVPPALDRLVLQLLAKEPQDRPDSAAEVAAELEAIEPHGAALVPPTVVVTTMDAEVEQGAAAERTSSGTLAGEWRECLIELLDEADRERQLSTRTDNQYWRDLSRAAWATAWVDPDRASRLITQAEQHVRQVESGPMLITTLAELGASVFHFAPAHAARLLSETHQLLFPLTDNDKLRQELLREVLVSQAYVDPERAARLAPSLASPVARDTVYSFAAHVAAESDPAAAREYQAMITDPARRAKAGHQIRIEEAKASTHVAGAVKAVAALPSSYDRAKALCATVRAWADTRPETAVELLPRAERSVRLAVQDRVAELRLTAAAAQQRSDLVEVARTQNLIERILRRHEDGEEDEATGDSRIDWLHRTLADARSVTARRSQDDVRALRTAREQAAEARLLTDPSHRASELIEAALELALPRRIPLPEAPVPTPPPTHTVPTMAAPGPATPTGAHGRPGTEVWRSSLATPHDLATAGDVVLWTAGDTAGGISARTGRSLWTAIDDQGVVAPPLNAGRSLRSAVGQQAVYLAVGGVDAPGVRIVAREVGGGRVFWWSDLADSTREEEENPLLVRDGVVLYHDRTSTTALDPGTGRPVWTRRHPSNGLRVVTAGHGHVVLIDDTRIHGVDSTSGEPRWSHARDAGVAGGPDTALIHLWDVDSVRALDASTGHLVWSRGPYGRTAPGATLPLIVGGRAFIAAHSPARKGDVVAALDATTGALLWEERVVRHTGDTCWVDIVGVHGDAVVVRAAWGGTGWRGGLNRKPFLTTLDAATGKPRWRWESERLGRRTAVISGDHVIVPCPHYTAVALPAGHHRGTVRPIM